MDIKEFINLIKNLKEHVSSFASGKDEIQPGVFIGKNVSIEPYVFFDTSAGPIVIGDDSKINASAILRGPLLIGNNCKIGGDVQHSIFADFSNKQHYGYVGYSYIGSWVNIGGGTSIGTLKNTYGEIKMGGMDTGLSILGAIVGDYVKTGGNSFIFPGKIIGAGAHVYGMITEDVPAFTSVTPAGLYEIPKEVTLKAQKIMMARRSVEFKNEDEEKINKLYSDTEKDRENAGVKKEKLKF